jgi:hypothetical protein
VRPYDRPEYAEIDTSETGFLIPLEGDSGVQAKFQSEEYLRALKVAAKRVQITHRWSQEGRLPNSGQWIALVRLIKVNRSPVTREWTADATSGTAAKNQAIWIESADSVGFSMGFTCTSLSRKSTRQNSSIGIPPVRWLRHGHRGRAECNKSPRRWRPDIASMRSGRKSRRSGCGKRILLPSPTRSRYHDGRNVWRDDL